MIKPHYLIIRKKTYLIIFRDLKFALSLNMCIRLYKTSYS